MAFSIRFSHATTSFSAAANSLSRRFCVFTASDLSFSAQAGHFPEAEAAAAVDFAVSVLWGNWWLQPEKMNLLKGIVLEEIWRVKVILSRKVEMGLDGIHHLDLILDSEVRTYCWRIHLYISHQYLRAVTRYMLRLDSTDRGNPMGERTCFLI